MHPKVPGLPDPVGQVPDSVWMQEVGGLADIWVGGFFPATSIAAVSNFFSGHLRGTMARWADWWHLWAPMPREESGWSCPGGGARRCHGWGQLRAGSQQVLVVRCLGIIDEGWEVRKQCRGCPARVEHPHTLAPQLPIPSNQCQNPEHPSSPSAVQSCPCWVTMETGSGSRIDGYLFIGECRVL